MSKEQHVNQLVRIIKESTTPEEYHILKEAGNIFFEYVTQFKINEKDQEYIEDKLESQGLLKFTVGV